MIYPTHFEQKIDFTTIRQLLKDKCISTLGIEKVDEIHFSSNFDEIFHWLSETNEMLKVLTTEVQELPVNHFYDLRSSLSKIRIEGLYLTETEIFQLHQALENVLTITAYIAQLNAQLYPCLHQLISDASIFKPIIQRIDVILSKFGKIKDQASPQLAQIRKNMAEVQNNISKSIQEILRKAQTNGYVEKDTTPALREGRLVIPVPQAFKRKINGIIHDESASGKTVYVEPAEIVEMNNRLRELEGEERREIIRILTLFTDFVRPFLPDIQQSQEFLAKIDFLRAKALLAIELNAIQPQLENHCLIDWYKAVHPLLFLSFSKQNKKVVPLDIQLNDKQRILIISGPNAGGKSVCLKTTALLQYMLQCGLLIPLHESSRTGIFEHLFIDIGDEQSIEDDLSTYSSHLLNMKFFIRHSNDRTLLLIDEFGSGTEPQLGGAIAESVLDRINCNKAFGVITTHYTNLKQFAEETEGIVNGAMLFDRQKLQPLFQLQIGMPGSSFAIEIARKIGLPEEIIDQASKKIGKDYLNYDRYVQDIIRDKRYWQNKREQIKLKEKQMDETISRYESELTELKRQRVEIIKKAKEEAQNLLEETNAKIENTIRQIKEAQAEKEKTKDIRKELENFKQTVNQPVNSQIKEKPVVVPIKKKLVKKDSIVDNPNKKESPEEKISIGSNVRLKNQNTSGIVLEINGNQAVVAIGQMKSSIPLSKLEPLSRTKLKKETQNKKNIHVDTIETVRRRKLEFKTEIDVRGMRSNEALQAITYYIDDAIMVGVPSVRILHGTGTGALRQIIREYLRSIPVVRNFHDEHIQFGGSGITVVEFE
ncbi:MAG: Smr/MutS family protein [Paludibacteraceae bacterium]|nr:Smr/MutS family protein [Paludibacteraceae bacterium]